MFFSLFKNKQADLAAPDEPPRGLEVSCAWLAANRGRVTVIDVRNPDEWAQSRMPGTELVPLPRLHELLDGRDDRANTFIVHCRSGKRSLTAVAAMRKLGFTESYSLAGGILRWAEEGLPVERGA